jgi:hypothetical protein
MSLVRLWVTLDTKNLTPAQTREAFIQAVRDAVTTAQFQGRVDRTIADQLRYALTQREPQQ